MNDIFDTSLEYKSFTVDSTKTFFKNNMVTIIVLIIILGIVYYVNKMAGDYTIIKLLKNGFVKGLIVFILIIYTIKYWRYNKFSVIIMVLFICTLFYVVNDDVESTEKFTTYIYNNMNKSPPVYTLNSQPEYKTVGCTHIPPNSECHKNKNKVLMDGPSQQFDNTCTLIGDDSYQTGNDDELITQLDTFNNMSEIFDARDFNIHTTNGFKKMNGVSNNICNGPICSRPKSQILNY